MSCVSGKMLGVLGQVLTNGDRLRHTGDRLCVLYAGSSHYIERY